MPLGTLHGQPSNASGGHLKLMFEASTRVINFPTTDLLFVHEVTSESGGSVEMDATRILLTSSWLSTKERQQFFRNITDQTVCLRVATTFGL